MDKQLLVEEIYRKSSFLCLGLDTDLTKIPKHLLVNPDPVFAFNKLMIDSLCNFVVAVKINTAFYEVNGADGWVSLEKTIKYLLTTKIAKTDVRPGIAQKVLKNI